MQTPQPLTPVQQHAEWIRQIKTQGYVSQMRERDIEKHLVNRVNELGGEVRKVKWVGRRGAPDRIVMARPDNGGYRCPIWVELKAPGKQAEPHQLREHERMRRMGQRVVVIDSIEGVEEIFV